jgi:23S rRNA-/tRNA-specific pseudouridylate synthase
MASPFKVHPQEDSLRPDRFLRGRHPALSRDEALALLKSGKLVSAGKALGLKSILRSGQALTIADGAGPWAMPLPIHFLRPGWLVIEKSAGLPIHPGTGHEDRGATLLGWVEKFWPAPEQDQELSILGRLDRLTSGLVVMARSTKMKKRLTRCQEAGRLTKKYLGLVHGHLKGQGTWQDDLPSLRDRHQEGDTRMEEAKTKWQALWSNDSFTLVEFQPLTGRKHQIRRHGSGVGHCVVGDPRYGQRRSEQALIKQADLDAGQSMMLHAFSLTIDDAELLPKKTITTAVPPRFLKMGEALGVKEATLRGAIEASSPC